MVLPDVQFSSEGDVNASINDCGRIPRCRARMAISLAAGALLLAASPALWAADSGERHGNLCRQVWRSHRGNQACLPDQGPDAVSGKMGRQLVFAATDMSDAIRSATTFSCVSGKLESGVTADLDIMPGCVLAGYQRPARAGVGRRQTRDRSAERRHNAEDGGRSWATTVRRQAYLKLTSIST